MSTASRHDAWQAGASYDRYMGRWSRRIAPLFLEWLDAPPGLDWLEVGCGTGALSSAILAQCAPRSLLAVDPSEGFLAQARAAVADPRAEFRVGSAQALGVEAQSRDVIVSGLVLNFVPARVAALAEMKHAVKLGGTLAFYVWDYPGGGLAFLRRFWTAAVALDPRAGDLTEDHRFPFCTRDGLIEMAHQAGLRNVESKAIEAPTIFADFDDYWTPFTLGAGPAPGYVASLSPEAGAALRKLLDDTLPREPDGSIRLTARAWALKARAV